MAQAMERNGTESETFDTRVANAESAASKGDWARAVEEYEALVEADSKRVELLYELARAYEGSGRVGDAIRVLTDPRIAALSKSKSRLAGVYIRAKDYAAAMPLVEAVHAASPTNPKFTKWLGQCHEQRARKARDSGDWA